MLKKIKENPRMSREAIIRQAVSQHVEKGDLSVAIEEASKYTDTKYIENLKEQE